MLIPLHLFAFEISSLSGMPVKDDIVLYPAKVEISMNSGMSITKYIDIQNRTGRDELFTLGVDDFAPDQSSGAIVLGKTVGGLNSSLKTYIGVSKDEFVLAQGEQAHIPVVINIPKDVTPGGLYGVVLVSGRPLKNLSGATNVVTRVGSLFFVKVLGEVKELGKFNSFTYHDHVFNLEFENDGDMYLNPYGIINVYEYYTRRLVKKIDVDPWFVLPRSTRIRSLSIDNLGPGKYAAEASLNRGYDNLVDNKYVNFDVSASAGSASVYRTTIEWAAVAIVLFFLIFYVKF